jgi:tRNA threonylcarbamoyladenosine biosynthesis protein TsaB
VDTFLRELGWKVEELDGLAVTIGPGSFTGLRIGLTTVKTLAWSLKKPFAAIPSLDALAAPFAFACLPICTLIDARKKEVFAAFFQADAKGGLLRRSPYLVVGPERVAEMVQERTLFCGDGWLAYGGVLRKELGDLAQEAPGPSHLIRASFVGELARRKFASGAADDPMKAVPLYVRPSEAELNHPGSQGKTSGKIDS